MRKRKARDSDDAVHPEPARIESIKIQNYRLLADVTISDVTPMTVLLGPNGSGKSTVFDAFQFLSDCFRMNLRYAWDIRGQGKELKSRGHDGPVVFEIVYRENPQCDAITYHLEIDQDNRGPVVVREWLAWNGDRPFRFLDIENGKGTAVEGEMPDQNGKRISTTLSASDVLAVNTLGQFAEHPRIVALRNFISDWYVSYLSIADTRGIQETGPQPRLTKSGDNVSNVLQYMQESCPQQLEQIYQSLSEYIPQLERIEPKTLENGQLLLLLKDRAFEKPVLAKYVSDGTLKMLCYLLVLMDPQPPQFIGIEEPENYLHPRLLLPLAELCRSASERTQLLATTHSPYFLDGCDLHEVRVLYRGQDGFTRAEALQMNRRVKALVEAGAKLGELWLEGHFGVGDPLTNSGWPHTATQG